AGDAWGLTDEERLLCACALAAEVSPPLARLLAYLAGDAMRPGLPVESAAAVLSAGAGGVLALSPLLDDSARLRRLAVVRVRGAAALPLLKRMLRAAPRLLALARGELGIDDRLAGAELRGAGAPGLVTPHLPAEVIAGLLAIARRAHRDDPIG